jgi:uncharacterized protein (TIGR02594 family)
MRWAITQEIMRPFEAALSLYGEKEIKGKQDNPKIIQMFNDLGFNGEKLKDETSWCAAFVNWILMSTGYKNTGKLNARSFLDLSNETEQPELGDIAIFWRESIDSWKGHVGFYIREKDGWIYVLGGNQNNEVNIKGYPKSRLLGYRKPQRLSL